MSVPQHSSDFLSSNTVHDLQQKSDQNNTDDSKGDTSVKNSDQQSSSTSGAKHELEGKDDMNWEDYGGYFRVKRRKLEEQFRDMVGEKQSNIFQGVTVYVNGWTEPSNDELKRMIHAHGGNYVFNLYGNTKVTHTIATNLPNSKIKNLGDSVVCTPAWIVDCISAGHQLPTDGYLLYSNHGSQKKLNFSKTVQAKQIEKGKEKLESFSSDNPSNVAKLQQENCISGNQSVNDDSAHTRTCNSVASDGSDAKELQHIPSASGKVNAYNPSKGAEFVNEFFTHSRLHYLSTWSSELKQFTARMVNHIQPRYPKLDPSQSLRAQHHRAVVHIDLDCFFVSVSIRDKPHLKGKPVAVTHAGIRAPQSAGASPIKHLQDSTSDVASCSYEARNAGVRNGMSVGKAVKLCPNLELLPYDFEGYRQVSQLFYETLLLVSSTVEAVSCDEAYLELTDYVEDFQRVETVISELRKEVEAKTGCTVSAGISHNMLLARLSTRKAKPNGQFYLAADRAESFLASLSVHDLPGVGYSTTNKLNGMGIETCGELRALTLAKLQKDFGLKNGTMLYEYSRGIDSRVLKVTSERKSVSVDINYGIRFTDISEAESLIKNLADELEKRAKDAEVTGGNVTLKMKVRKPDVPRETWKYLGHGVCDNVSRSTLLLQPTQDAKEIGQLAIKLLRQVRVVASDIRGMGLQLSKLVSTHAESAALKEGANLRTMFQSASSAPKPDPTSQYNILHDALSELPTTNKTLHTYFQSGQQMAKSTHLLSDYSLPSTGATLTKSATSDESFLIDLPPASQLDCSVLEALPSSMRNQILRSYEKSVKNKENQLSDLIEREKQEIVRLLTSSANDFNVQESPDLAPPSVVSDHVTHATKDTLNERESEVDSSQGVEQKSVPKCEVVAVVDNQGEFLSEFRKYIREWIANSRDGPKQCDAVKFTDFFTSFSETNLEVTLIILRFFRRLVLKLERKGWTVYFNTLLARVQEVTRQRSGGTLKIAEVDV